MMFGSKHYILCTGSFEQFGPLIGMEQLGTELRCTILVPELRTVGTQMVFAKSPSHCGTVFYRTVPVPLRIFCIGIPFLTHRRPGRHCIHPPVNEYAELGIG